MLYRKILTLNSESTGYGSSTGEAALADFQAAGAADVAGVTLMRVANVPDLTERIKRLYRKSKGPAIL